MIVRSESLTFRALYLKSNFSQPRLSKHAQVKKNQTDYLRCSAISQHETIRGPLTRLLDFFHGQQGAVVLAGGSNGSGDYSGKGCF